MGKLTGLLMIVAGVGTAAYVYPLVGSSSDKAEKQLADVVAISTAAEPKRQPAPVVKQAEAPTPGPARVISAETSAGRPALTGSAPVPAPAPAVVAAAPPVAPSVVKPVEAPVPQAAKRPSADDEGKTTLTRDIQRELKRVGCLQGEADGTWNASTKQAMKQFIDRVNATLPTDEPDHILKTLVQGHPGNACGKSCPAGQTAASDGRCLPTAIMTQAPTPAKRPVATVAEAAPAPQVAATQVTAPQVPTPQVAAVPPVKTPPAPQVAAVPQQKATSAWETSVTTVVPPAMAAIAAAASLPDSKPLPGRMAIGAPTESPAAPATAPVVTQAQDEPPKTKFVVKPKVKPAVEKLEKSEKPEKTERAEKPERAEKAEKAERAEKAEKSEKAEKAERTEKAEKAEKPSRPSVGAVAAAERSEPPRRSSPPPAPRVVAVYRAPPPPRYVGAYSPPPVRDRPRFGPQIFRQLELTGR